VAGRSDVSKIICHVLRAISFGTSLALASPSIAVKIDRQSRPQNAWPVGKRQVAVGQGSKNKKVISEMLSEVHSTAVQLVSVARFSVRS
jgi:hypothetical protein